MGFPGEKTGGVRSLLSTKLTLTSGKIYKGFEDGWSCPPPTSLPESDPPSQDLGPLELPNCLPSCWPRGPGLGARRHVALRGICLQHTLEDQQCVQEKATKHRPQVLAV